MELDDVFDGTIVKCHDDNCGQTHTRYEKVDNVALGNDDSGLTIVLLLESGRYVYAKWIYDDDISENETIPRRMT